MADTKLSILIQLQDEASKAIADVGSKLKGLQGDMQPAVDASKAVGIGLLAAGTAAAGFGIAAIKAAGDAQAQMAKVQTTIDNTIENMSVKSLNALQKLADKSMGDGADIFEYVTNSVNKAAAAAVKMGFDDEDAAQSVATLYQRTGDMTKALQLNQTAMDLARAKNIDLGTATTLVGQVLSGNGRILKQYGIDIKDSATPLQALGQLQDKVSGQAKAFAGTFQGQMAVFQVSWQNFMETVGDKLLPAVTKLLEKANDFITNTLPVWIQKTQEIISWLKEHKEVVMIVAGAIVGALMPALISMAITLVTTVIPAFVAAAIALAPWMLAGALIAGIVAGVLWVIHHWDLVKQKAAEVWDWIKDHLAIIAIALGPVGPLVVAIVKTVDAIITHWNTIRDVTREVWTAIANFFTQIWASIKGTFQSAVNDITAMIQPLLNLIDKVKNALPTMNQGASLNPLSDSFQLPHFAAGGIVTGPTLAMVGEGGESEAIIPFSKLGALGGGSISIYITGNNILNDNDAVKLGDKIIRALKLHQKL